MPTAFKSLTKDVTNLVVTIVICAVWCAAMMPGMPGAQQVTQMRQARPAGMQQQMRAASMTARPITGQQAVAVAPQRAPGSLCHQ